VDGPKRWRAASTHAIRNSGLVDSREVRG
jgi:hypothetical protein